MNYMDSTSFSPLEVFLNDSALFKFYSDYYWASFLSIVIGANINCI